MSISIRSTSARLLDPEKNGSVDCVCIRSSVLATVLSIVLILTEVLMIIWIVLQGKLATDWAIAALCGLEILGIFSFLIIKLVKAREQMAYLVISLVLLASAFGDIICYLCRVYLDKELQIVSSVPTTTTTTPKFKSSNFTLTTTPAPAPPTTEPVAYFVPPPIHSFLLRFIFALTVLRIYLTMRKERKAKPQVVKKKEEKLPKQQEPPFAPAADVVRPKQAELKTAVEKKEDNNESKTRKIGKKKS